MIGILIVSLWLHLPPLVRLPQLERIPAPIVKAKAVKSPRADGLGYCSDQCTCGCVFGGTCRCGVVPGILLTPRERPPVFISRTLTPTPQNC